MNVTYNLSPDFKDYSMANAWRLILEGDQSRPVTTPATPLPRPDFSSLEKILPESRLIGLKITSGCQDRFQ